MTIVNRASKRKKVGSAAVALVLLAGVSCGGGGGGGSGSTTGEPTVPNSSDFTSGGGTTERTVIDRYVNNVIIAFYNQLDASAVELVRTVTVLQQSPSAQALADARAAWVATRVPWENSETALFGPVDFYGFDPAMDSWPVNRTDLEGVINSSVPLTTATVANLDNALKGFHTIEFLLFGEGGAKQVSDFTPREYDYLIATTSELQSVTSQLRLSWTDGIQGQPPFALQVTQAGQGSTVFPTESSAIEQMVRGMITICDEVANGKIADPFTQRDPNIVESQFSYNSIADFANNIRGVRIALDQAVSGFIIEHDAALNGRLIASIDTAIAAIQRIPEPFREAIKDPANDATIIQAQEATRAVQAILEGEVIPLVLSQ